MAILEKLDSSVWSYCFEVPVEIAKRMIEGDHKRVKCTLNSTIEIQAGLMPKGEGNYFITLNKEVRKKLKLDIGDKIEVQIVKDESKYGLPMPEEMFELLAIDDEADSYFHALTMGKQRSLLFLIGKPKNSDTRLKKALTVVDYLKSSKGKLDFKELNEAFKHSTHQ